MEHQIDQSSLEEAFEVVSHPEEGKQENLTREEESPEVEQPEGENEDYSAWDDDHDGHDQQNIAEGIVHEEKSSLDPQSIEEQEEEKKGGHEPLREARAYCSSLKCPFCE